VLRTVLLLSVSFWLTFGGARAAELSLAIIAEDDDAATSADLLLAALTDQPNLRLLERSELQKIVAEQSLSLASSQELLRAGRLAGADALLLLDHFSRPAEEGKRPQEVLGLRLIMVGPGVLLHTADYAWPLPDMAEWSGTTARTLAPHFGRAGVPEGAGLKLSLLSFRSPTDSRESRLLDRELNSVLLKRLARETNVFVLERQKLGATLLERELNTEASPFWRGSYLIDGTVNKLGYTTNAISVEGRIVSPGGKATNVVELSGKRSELPELIDKLVVTILKSADQISTLKRYGSLRKRNGHCAGAFCRRRNQPLTQRGRSASKMRRPQLSEWKRMGEQRSRSQRLPILTPRCVGGASTSRRDRKHSPAE
jgi:curli biogenesis system outer membrane secretion channel CsgG